MLKYTGNKTYRIEDSVSDDERTAEAAVLIIISAIGLIGNFIVLALILLVANLRRASNAFLFHHSIIDLIKSGYCLPFAFSLMTKEPPTYCNLLGGSYIVFITTSSFNLLAMVMNEAYQFSDLNLGIRESRNYCCVIFGIFIIWFTSLILNLGIAFIPGNTSYDIGVANCVFKYGITRNYVLHVLWIILISIGLALTIIYLRVLYVDISRSSYYRFLTLIRATMSIDPNRHDASRRDSSGLERHHIENVEKISMKKLVHLMIVTGLFVGFWYPLFLLTLIDKNFNASVLAYKWLTILAWSNSAVSPIIFIFYIKTDCCHNISMFKPEPEASMTSITRDRRRYDGTQSQSHSRSTTYNEIANRAESDPSLDDHTEYRPLSKSLQSGDLETIQDV
ncbi:unnamed protein product [Owenia fusiformis]|uniref:G-protein coupled receptors family 1 profile domain-containing protein n=1 Tax=Owenia fusiformis TaxID=6347 RepID=A0A8S4PXE9_OWEFU|nr:unnamed protein product [Owenia fusiformis]